MASVFKLRNMSSKKNITELAETIKDNFDGELVCSEYQDLNDNTKVLVMNYEKYYFRVSSYVGLSIIVTEYNGTQTAVITGFGGGGGLLNISYGANNSFAKKVVNLLTGSGFEEYEE